MSSQRSLLQQRLVTPAGGQQGHPYGTAATPMLMPLAQVAFNNGHGLYDELSPAPPATGDVNAVPLATLYNGSWGPVKSAGRP